MNRVNFLTLCRRLDAAVAAGLLEEGLAQRVRLSAYLQAASSGEAVTGATALPRVATSAPPVSGEALARWLGLSRAAVHKHMDVLRAEGFPIESAAGAGYRLVGCDAGLADLLVPEVVIPYLLDRFAPGEEWFVGLPYLYRQSCSSTNLILREEWFPAGAVAVAEHQQAGRGRLNRTWTDQAGKDLTFSALLRPSVPPAQAHLLSLVAALAVAHAVEEVPGFTGQARIKWPNDVVIGDTASGDRKFCGILVEGAMDADRLHWVVAGIGVNVNGDSRTLLQDIAARGDEGVETRLAPISLRDHLGVAVPRAPFLVSLLDHLTREWTRLEEAVRGEESDREEQGGVAALLREIRARDALAGAQVTAQGAGRTGMTVSGEAVGIGPAGQLLLHLSSGEIVPIFAGDVSVRRRPL